MRHLMSFLSLAIILGLLSSCAGSGKPVELKFNPKTGDKFKTTVSLNMDMEMEGAPEEAAAMNNMNMKMEMVTIMNTLKDSADQVKMETTFEKFDMKMPGLGGMSNNLDDMIKGLQGKSVIMSVSSSGEVKEVTGLDKLFGGDAIMLSTIDKQINQSFSQGMAYLPGKTVHVGDTWTNEVVQKQQMGMTSTIKNTWTLEKVSGDIAYISVISTVDMDGGSGPLQQGQIDITQEGDMEVDIPTGMTMAGNLTQSMKMDMGMAKINAKTKVTMVTKQM